VIESMTQQGSRPTAGRVTLHYAGCLTDMSFRRLVFLLTLCSVAAFPGTAAGAAMQRLKLHVSPAGEIRLDQAVTVTLADRRDADAQSGVPGDVRGRSAVE